MKILELVLKLVVVDRKQAVLKRDTERARERNSEREEEKLSSKMRAQHMFGSLPLACKLHWRPY